VFFRLLRLRYLARPADVASLNGWTTSCSVDPAWNVVLLGILQHVQANDDGSLPAFVNTKIGRGLAGKKMSAYSPTLHAVAFISKQDSTSEQNICHTNKRTGAE